MIQSICLAVLICAGTGQSTRPSPANLTKSELTQVVAASLETGRMRGLPVLTEEELATIRQNTALELSSEATVPETVSVQGLSETTLEIILARPVLLLSKDQEYCRVQAKCRLMGIVAAIEIAKKMPMPTPPQREELVHQIEHVLFQMGTAINRELGSTMSTGGVDEYVHRFRMTMVRAVDNPLTYSYKRPLLPRDLDALLTDLHERLSNTKERAFRRFREDVPSPDSPAYERSLRGVEHEVLFEILGFVDRQLGRLTSVPSEEHLDIESLVPGVSQAARIAAEYDRAELLSAARQAALAKK